MKIGFDNEKYLQMQSSHIRERLDQFGGKLYLEFGGKLFDDYHASRVLPGFEPDSKMRMLQQLKDEVEIVIAINAADIESNKIRGDLGIPYDDFYTATTLNDATNIVTELYKTIGEKMAVNLVGFTKGGVDVGKVAGGFKLDSDLGNKSDLEKFITYCKQNGITSFMDFDLVRFNKNGAGLNTLSDKAVTVNGQVVNCYNYNIWSRTRDYDLENYSLVARAKLFDVAEELVKNTNKFKLTGVGLNTLSNYCYSDYSSVESFVKGNMAKDVVKILGDVKKNNTNLAINNANDYAAVFATQIYDVPLQSTGHNLFDCDVPFYEIVFKGYVSMSTPSVNLSANEKETILKAVETGCGLGYTLIKNYDPKLLATAESSFYGSAYSDIKPYIEDAVSQNKDYYNKINGATIKDHIIYENGLRKTVFDNGYSVYVNYGDKREAVAGVSVEALSYKVVKGENAQ